MRDTIFVSRRGPATRPLTRLTLPPSFERPAPAAATGLEVLSVELIAGGALELLRGAAVPA
jgi:hypothetical protein